MPQTTAGRLFAPVKRVAHALDVRPGQSLLALLTNHAEIGDMSLQAARKELHDQGAYLALGSASPAGSLPSPDTLAAAIHVPQPSPLASRQPGSPEGTIPASHGAQLSQLAYSRSVQHTQVLTVRRGCCCT